jgi:hypothetical protein
MNEFGDDLESELRESRPAPRGEVLDSLVTKITARPAPARRGAWQLRLAGLMAAAALVAVAGLGGVSVAADSVSKTAKAGHHEHGDGGKNHEGEDEDDDDHGRDEHSHDGHGDGHHGEHHGHQVPICYNGSTKVRYVSKKKAVRIVEIQHRGVYATPGHPPTCPVI